MDWLSSVTESINECMHYDLPGGESSSPLVFLTPAAFFNRLRDRMALEDGGGTGTGTKKSRLPTYCQAGYRCETPSLGTMATTYVWKIHSIRLLKKMFDTPKVALQISRYATKLEL